jgi:hypothetical protein
VLRIGLLPGDQMRGGGLTRAVLGRAPKAPSGGVEDEPETVKPLSCPAREEDEPETVKPLSCPAREEGMESRFIWNKT